MVIKVIAMRIIPESTSKYSASPPHTPAIFESVDDRISRLMQTRFPADTSIWRAPQNEQKFEYSAISFRQFAQVIAVLLTKTQCFRDDPSFKSTLNYVRR